jgi:DNA repair photolyase
MRFEKKGFNPCKECTVLGASCATKKACEPVRQKLRAYDGIRFTSDGFDCALPVTIDSHSACSFGCLYCFSDNLVQHRQGSKTVGQTSLKKIENIFSGKDTKEARKYQKALKYDRRNKHGFPCPVQLGGICDAADNIERNQGWLLDFIKLANKYDQPVRISTKGNLFLSDEYLAAISEKPELYWVAFSIITPDDELLGKIDKRAPNASERLESMKRLSARGIKTSLRFRPILPGFSDSTPKYPHAWKTLIEKATEAGACAISYEVGFVPGMMTEDIKTRWREIERISGRQLIKIYHNLFGRQACTRPSYMWTEDIMHKIRDTAKTCGLTVGVSDPVWKQLSEVGCCCGIQPDDPVFGNWERENATNALIEASKNGGEVFFEDINPKWAKDVLMTDLCNMGVGPKVIYDKRHKTWEDKLREDWNGLGKQRSPLNYFQGALMPVGKDNKQDIVYKYEGLERKNPKHTPGWDCA